MYGNPAFAIQRVEVRTDGVIAPDVIRRWALVRPGQNLLALDLMRVKRDLEMYSPIAGVCVERVLPATLRISVKERQPVAQAFSLEPRRGGGFNTVPHDFDETGVVIQPLDPAWRLTPAPTNEFLTTLTGVPPKDLNPGRQAESPQVLAALRLLGQLDRSPMAGIVELQTINVASPEILDAVTSQGRASLLRSTISMSSCATGGTFTTTARRRARPSPPWTSPSPTICRCAGSLPARCRRSPARMSNPTTRKGKMFDPLIVGLEIGTSKICVVVGEINAAGALNIIGVGQARSRGVRKGEIAEPALAEEDVRNAIVDAEQMANVEIRSVYLGVTGQHIRGFSNHGVHPVVSADREITDEDVQDAIKNAKAVNLPVENSIIHAIRQHFQVDAQSGILNPVGMFGAKVEVDVHVVHGHGNRLKNSLAVVKGLQLNVETVVFNGLASALALLTNEQKELGSLVIDIGGGTTDYAVYCDGIIKHTGVLAVGGDHVSNDLSFGLKVPLGRAEQLKLEHASAELLPEVKGRTVDCPARWGFLPRPSTSNTCTALPRCGWRRFSS